MPLPPFLLPMQSAVLPAPSSTSSSGAASTGGAPAAFGALPFTMQTQQKSQWCWAGVAASVAGFYGTASTVQCAIASGELGLACCPTNSAAAGCNIPWYLDRALRRVGHFDRMTFTSETFPVVSGEVNGNRPLGARVAWASSGAHFVILAGWSIDTSGVEYVDIHDPFYGPTTATYSSFCTSYRSPGDTWSHSYFTAAAPASGGGIIAGAPLSA
jgi:hypothetical protein